MSLKHSYTLAAPFYDAFLTAATRGARKRSLSALSHFPPRDVLLLGVGTGLDLPHLPNQHRYVGLDLTAAMLLRARPRAANLQFIPLRGDVQRLPFGDASFDVAVLHLILAVVPAPTLCLAEAVRVLKPGGQLLIFDKFLRRGEAGWKRLLNPLTCWKRSAASG
ncbi:MAG: class I SAM-dependent methyltransferase [Sulfuritalea sp.]|nr:class I SAM-dependent methyltransferase [Sulfuritalea sp.]